MTVGAPGSRDTDGRMTATRCDLRRHGVPRGGRGYGGRGRLREDLGSLAGAQRDAGDELLGHPEATGHLHALLVHEALFHELALGAGEGRCADTGAFGGARQGLARSLREGELPGQKTDGVRGQARVPDEVVGEPSEGARRRDTVPVDHGGSPNFHWWFRPSRTGCCRCGGRLRVRPARRTEDVLSRVTVPHGACACGRVE